MESFQVLLERPLDRDCFEKAVGGLPKAVYRAKGFVLFPEGRFLFNLVAGRYDLEPASGTDGPLGIVFIGEKILFLEPRVSSQIQLCAGPRPPTPSPAVDGF
jgi:G3E family GTPase